MTDLETAVGGAVEELNGRRDSESYSAEVGTYNDGPAIDVQKNGQACSTRGGMHHFFRAAHDAGYVVSNVKVFETFATGEPHTRLFLCDAEKRLDIESETEGEWLDGFAAGVFFTTSIYTHEANNSIDLEPPYPASGEVHVEGGEDATVYEIIREREGVTTAEDAAQWVRDNGSVGHAHVSDSGPDERNPYAASKHGDETPPGWERATEYHSDSYLVKSE